MQVRSRPRARSRERVNHEGDADDVAGFKSTPSVTVPAACDRRRRVALDGLDDAPRASRNVASRQCRRRRRSRARRRHRRRGQPAGSDDVDARERVTLHLTHAADAASSRRRRRRRVPEVTLLPRRVALLLEETLPQRLVHVERLPQEPNPVRRDRGHDERGNREEEADQRERERDVRLLLDPLVLLVPRAVVLVPYVGVELKGVRWS